MRKMLAHQYAELDREILQNTIDNRLDGLNRLIERLREIAANRYITAQISQPESDTR